MVSAEERYGELWAAAQSPIRPGGSMLIYQTFATAAPATFEARARSAGFDRYGAAAVEAERGGLLWGVYQVLGKTCPTIYVLERRA